MEIPVVQQEDGKDNHWAAIFPKPGLPRANHYRLSNKSHATTKQAFGPLAVTCASAYLQRIHSAFFQNPNKVLQKYWKILCILYFGSGAGWFCVFLCFICRLLQWCVSAKLSAPFDFCYLGLSCVVMSIEGAKAFCFCSDLIFVSILHLKCHGSMNPRLQYELDLKIYIYILIFPSSTGLPRRLQKWIWKSCWPSVLLWWVGSQMCVRVISKFLSLEPSNIFPGPSYFTDTGKKINFMFLSFSSDFCPVFCLPSDRFPIGRVVTNLTPIWIDQQFRNTFRLLLTLI